MTAVGVEVRPLRQITGDSEFNEVFLDEVEVPVDHLIGPGERRLACGEHDARQRARRHVRVEGAGAPRGRDGSPGRRRARAEGLRRDPLVRQRLAQAWIEVEIFRLHNQRTLTRLARGEDIGPESSLVKLFWAGMSQRVSDTAVAVLGPDSLLMPDDEHAVDRGRWALGLLATRANSIMGGTSEIQRNILGERLLGLPREAGSEAKRGESMNACLPTGTGRGRWLPARSDGIGSAYARAMAERGCNAALLAVARGTARRGHRELGGRADMVRRRAAAPGRPGDGLDDPQRRRQDHAPARRWHHA